MSMGKWKKMQPETTYQAILGQILKEWRKKKGMDQIQVAEKMKMNRSSWSRIENGNTMVNIQQLQKIGEIFDRGAHEILQEADNIASSLKNEGYIVHYDSIEEVRSESSGSQGWALIGGAVLGLLVGRMLFGGDNDSKDGKGES